METLEKEFMTIFLNMGRTYGLEDLPLKVVGILYIEPEEVSMEEVCKRTGYSLASVSNTMRLLENVGMVKRIRKPKTKKVFFYMDKNIFELNIKKLKAIIEIIKPVKEILPQIIGKYKNKAKDEKARKKLQVMENYYKQVVEFEKIIDSWVQDLGKISMDNLQK